MINAITGLPNRVSHLREDVVIDGSLTINGDFTSNLCNVTGGTLSGSTLLLNTTCSATTISVTGFTSSSTFGYFYQTVANVAGTIAANNGKALFQSAGTANSAGFTMVPASGDITVASAGTYKISFSVAGAEANAFGVFVGGSVVAGSIYGSGAGTQQNTGSVIVALSASDVVSLRTVNCAAAITLQLAGTTNAAQIVTSITLEKLA